MTKTIRTIILLTPLFGLSCYEPGASTIHGLPCTKDEACEGIYVCHQGFCLEEGETVLDNCRDGEQQKAEFCYFTDERITVEIPPAFDRWSGQGDFNGDGRIDFAVMDDREVTTAVFQGGSYDRTTVFRQPEPDTGRIHGMSVGDANGDGNADIIVLTEGTDFFVQIDAYVGDGTGHAFNKVVSNVFVEGEVGPAIIGDFTGEGIPDAFFTDTDEGLSGWLAPGMGGGAFGPAEEISAGTFSGDRAQVADFNNDGVMEFLYVQRDNDLIAVMQAVPTPTMNAFTLALGIQLNTDSEPNEVVANDVNGDGVLDLVVSHASSDTLILFTGNEAREEVYRDDDRTVFDVIEGNGGAIADFDGDGEVDLVFAGQDRNQFWPAWGYLEWGTPIEGELRKVSRLQLTHINDDMVPDFLVYEARDDRGFKVHIYPANP